MGSSGRRADSASSAARVWRSSDCSCCPSARSATLAHTHTHTHTQPSAALRRVRVSGSSEEHQRGRLLSGGFMAREEGVRE